MKILIDAHIFDGKFQGTRTYIKGLYTELIRRNPSWDFIFVASDTENLESEFPNRGNVSFEKYRFKNSFIRLFCELPYIIYKRKVDYSHFQYLSPFLKVGKYIITNHDILSRDKRFRSYFPFFSEVIKWPLFSYAAKNADVLFTVSKYSQKDISDQYGIPVSRIGITPNSVNIIRGDKKVNLKSKNILYVSRIEPRKNHVSLLKAFVNLKLNEQGYKLIFVGKYDLSYPEYDEVVSENAEILKDSFVCLSGLTDQQLMDQYMDTALVVYPSLAEGFGIPPLEAAVIDLKVICSNATAMEEFDFFKYHYNPEDQLKLEDLIAEALQDDNYPFKEIRNKVLNTYNWEHAAIVFENRILD